jgi:hypothetical protein
MDIPPVGITGQFEANVIDPSGNVPTNVIRITDVWRVDCSWYIDGLLASSLGGQWRLQVVLEGLGSALEGETVVTAPPPIANWPTAPNLDGRTGPGNPYTHSFSFGPGVPGLGGQPSVLGNVGVALTYIDAANTPGPIAAFVDLGVVQFFEP